MKHACLFSVIFFVYSLGYGAQNILTCGFSTDLSEASKTAHCGDSLTVGDLGPCGQVIAPGLALIPIMEVQLAASSEPSQQKIYYINQAPEGEEPRPFAGLQNDSVVINEYFFDLHDLHMRWSSQYMIDDLGMFDFILERGEQVLAGPVSMEVRLSLSKMAVAQGALFSGYFLLNSAPLEESDPFLCIYQ